MKKYLVFNSLFLFSCCVGLYLEERATMGHVTYLFLLFMLCSLPLLSANPFQGRRVLFTFFLGYAFLAFGLLPYADLFFDFYQSALIPRAELFSPGEAMILLGLVCFILAYLLVNRLLGRRVSRLAQRNWNLRYLPLLGIVCWMSGAAVTVDVSFTIGGSEQRMQELGGFAGFYLNARYFMMLGELIVAYNYIMTGKRSAGLLLLFVIVTGLFIGLIVDSKEVGFRAFAIYVVAQLLLKGEVPVKTILAGLVLATIGFSIFAQYRSIIGSQDLNSRVNAYENLGENIEDIVSGSSDLEQTFGFGLNYLFSRLSLNGSTEMVVSAAGETVPFRNGSTLTPVFYGFIPRFILPNKPDANIGRLINQEFEVSWSEKTYISSGQLAEFYWNYGVTGVIAGMAFIGMLFSFISNKLDLRQSPSVTRLLLLLCTIYILILRFEGGFAQYYIVWMRLMLLIYIMHLFMPKARLQQAKIPT